MKQGTGKWSACQEWEYGEKEEPQIRRPEFQPQLGSTQSLFPSGLSFSICRRREPDELSSEVPSGFEIPGCPNHLKWDYGKEQGRLFVTVFVICC